MKKNVIALAVAAAMVAPLAAQAEVSISGGLQAELAMVGGDGTAGMDKGLYAMDASEYGSESGGSYGFLKFSASEDLGGGMKALAMWNGVVNVGDGTAAGGMTGRDSYVGLTGGFGTVLAGTLSTPYKSSTVKWDPFVMTAAQARGSFGMSALHNGYVSNALAYANKFGPATVVLAVVLDESSDGVDSTNANHAKSFSVNAPVGPVEVALAYIDLTDFGGASGSWDKATATKLGVKWTSGAITVAGQYEMLDAGLGTSDDGDNDLYLTASYGMGANTFSAAVGQNTVKTAGASDETNTYMAIGMKHAFSKSTSAHVVYRACDNKVTAADDNENVLAAGLRVGF